MILLAEATRATEIASILENFRAYDLDNRRSIQNSIDNLEQLSTILRKLARQIGLVEDGEVDGKLSRKIVDDLDLLQHSIAYTLGDLWTILGAMPDPCIGIDYRTTWKDIVAHIKRARNQTLATRIESYTIFAMALYKSLRREPQRRGVRLDDLRKDINSLRLAQLSTRRLIPATEAINDLSTLQRSLQRTRRPSPSSPVMIKQPRSTERVRPLPMRPKVPIPTPSSPSAATTTTADSVDSSDSTPVVPSPPLSPNSPQSPTATFSSITSTSQASSAAEVETKHWVGRIFKDLPSTKMIDEKNRDAESACHTLPQDSTDWPSQDEYDRILKITFPGGLKMFYFLRASDYHTKIVCEWPTERTRTQTRTRTRTRTACLSLKDLHVKRNGSILYLCRHVAGYSHNTVWAQFKCPTLEWLVIFHLTFLALRSQDGRRPYTVPLDRELKGETCIFAGVITDNGYQHALRVYQDRSTSVLRLEAAVLEGTMKDTPVWTAFITHQVTSPIWMRHNYKSKRVYLADLKRHIFSSQYTPHLAPSGQHILAFDTISDAEDFEAIIKELSVRYFEDLTR